MLDKLGMLSKDDAIQVMDHYFVVESGLCSMRHQQALQLSRIRRANEKEKFDLIMRSKE